MKYIIRSLNVVVILLFFFIGYAWSMKGHSPNTAFDFSIGLDSILPLIPSFLVFYFIGYFYLFIPCYVIKNQQAFRLNIAIIFVLMAISFLIFKYYPVIMTKELSTGDGFLERLLYFQQTRDTKYNNLPSLHVSLNVFSWLVLLKHGNQFWRWSGVVAILIIVSTLLVKQHLVVDVISGCLLAGIGYKVHNLLLEKTHIKTTNILYYSAMLIMFVVIALGYQGIEPYLDNFVKIPWSSF